jgi:hypothetical protein
MFRRVSLAVAGGLLFVIGTAGGVLAAQPFVECGDPGAEMNPPGFDSGGFAKAEEHYAGEDGAHSFVSGNWHAVSQYDVACWHYTQAHN